MNIRDHQSIQKKSRNHISDFSDDVNEIQIKHDCKEYNYENDFKQESLHNFMAESFTASII